MVLFTDIEPEPPAHRKNGWVGWSILCTALAGLIVIAFVPAPFVIEIPGPVFDTLDSVSFDGEELPLISIEDEPTYETSGSLSLLTVSRVGNRENLPNWVEVAFAYFDASKAVVPVDAVYPVGVSVEQSNEAGRVLMENSQQEAVAAALTELGHEFESSLTVVEVVDGTPAAGVFEPGDVIQTVNGATFDDVSGLRREIGDNGADRPARVVVLRDGERQTLEVTPTMSEGEGSAPVFGIIVGGEYEFPFEVDIQLQNVGGSSAGMMFALGIIDKLTPGELTGGEDVAGTGEITAAGEVGAIGGIRQKLYGARDAGAEWFLAPQSNCDEVTGHVPSGITVFAVQTLDDALEALDVIESGADVSGLPTCPAA